MIKIYFTLILLAFCTLLLNAQNTPSSPCSHDAILARLLENNPNALLEMEENEAFIQQFIIGLKEKRAQGHKQLNTYVIPVVLHVFHVGDDGKIDMEQAQSGIDVLNNDYNGFNEGWNSIDPEFDAIKGTLDIEFCLASIDPEGNPTTGVVYYEDQNAMLNLIDLTQFAWDNYKYLNIYLPKYTNGSPNIFTGYASFPSSVNSDNNKDGIFYSSIRWGYGTHSELSPGQDWASVGSHEAGHWLNLFHTFQGGCTGQGDQVDDTPPTLGGTIILTGCDNNDLSCGVATNGENFMDYNHDCKKMFTQGQVDRMTAALNFPSRITLWSPENLTETGCSPPATSTLEKSNNDLILVYPNPSTDQINFKFGEIPTRFAIFDGHGKLIFNEIACGDLLNLNTSHFAGGVYFYCATIEHKIFSGKLVVMRR